MESGNNTMDKVRWSLTVSAEIDAEVRRILGIEGSTDADIARYVEETIRWRLLKARETVEHILARSEGVTLGGLKIKDLINEGRR